MRYPAGLEATQFVALDQRRRLWGQYAAMSFVTVACNETEV
jgi:hypothetical protein